LTQGTNRHHAASANKSPAQASSVSRRFCNAQAASRWLRAARMQQPEGRRLQQGTSNLDRRQVRFHRHRNQQDLRTLRPDWLVNVDIFDTSWCARKWYPTRVRDAAFGRVTTQPNIWTWTCSSQVSSCAVDIYIRGVYRVSGGGIWTLVRSSAIIVRVQLQPTGPPYSRSATQRFIQKRTEVGEHANRRNTRLARLTDSCTVRCT
jgi:hypothetical protein